MTDYLQHRPACQALPVGDHLGFFFYPSGKYVIYDYYNVPKHKQDAVRCGSYLGLVAELHARASRARGRSTIAK